MVRRVRFHPTLDNLIAILGSPGPVVTVLRSLGPAMITDSLMVENQKVKSFSQKLTELYDYSLQAASDLSWHYSLPLLVVANDRSVRFWKLLLK